MTSMRNKTDEELQKIVAEADATIHEGASDASIEAAETNWFAATQELDARSVLHSPHKK